MRRTTVRLLSALLAAASARAGPADAPFAPEIPRTSDAEALEDLELPLADPRRTLVHITPEQYFAMPVRPIQASYPIYHVRDVPQPRSHGAVSRSSRWSAAAAATRRRTTRTIA